MTALTKGIMSQSTQQKEALQRCVISAQDLTKEKDNGDDDEEEEPSNCAVGILIEGWKRQRLDSILTQYCGTHLLCRLPLCTNVDPKCTSLCFRTSCGTQDSRATKTNVIDLLYE